MCPCGNVDYLLCICPWAALLGHQEELCPALWECNILQSGCTSLQSSQQWTCFPFSPHHCQHVLSLEFLILVTLIGDTLNLSVVSFSWRLRMLNISWSALWLFRFLFWDFSVYLIQLLKLVFWGCGDWLLEFLVHFEY